MASLEMDGGIKIYLREIGKTPLLTREEEVELADRIKKGDKEARAHMIKANLRLVVKIAQDYVNYGLPLLDLISEGNIGLMKAVERFDPNKGGKLSTYAAWWIKQGIKRALANQSKTIRLPVHIGDKISKMRRVAMVLSEELGREPTDEELAKEIGIDRAKLSHLKSAALRPASLDAPMSDDDNTEFGENVADEKAHDPADLVSHMNMHMQLDDLLEVLDERERKIIVARFGLGGQKPKTLDEVASELMVDNANSTISETKLTGERIRQLQNIALGKLRRAFKKMEDPGPLEPFSGRKKSGEYEDDFAGGDDAMLEGEFEVIQHGDDASDKDSGKITPRNPVLTLGLVLKAKSQLLAIQSRFPTKPSESPQKKQITHTKTSPKKTLREPGTNGPPQLTPEQKKLVENLLLNRSDEGNIIYDKGLQKLMISYFLGINGCLRLDISDIARDMDLKEANIRRTLGSMASIFLAR